MAKRPDRDTVLIESIQGGDFSIVVDRATQYEIVTDLTQPSVARFELGDSGTWSAIRDAIAIGARFKVSVNDKPRVTGRLLTRNLAVSASAGGTVQVVVRTLLADALFTVCDTNIGVRNATLETIVLAAFKRMGLTKADFIFRADLARDLITGRSDPQKPALEIHNIKEEEARPHAPESIYAFVDRHLSRFGLMLWDAADGRIVIGKPDDSQTAAYIMTMRRGVASRTNNLLSVTKTEDFEEVPGMLGVFGVGGGKDVTKSRVRFVQRDATLDALAAQLDRVAVVIDEGITTQAQAEARARREMMRRSLNKDSWALETDGLSYWSGSEAIPYGIDTVADVRVDIAGAANGPYLIWQCTMKGNASESHKTNLVGVARGIWKL